MSTEDKFETRQAYIHGRLIMFRVPRPCHERWRRALARWLKTWRNT